MARTYTNMNEVTFNVNEFFLYATNQPFEPYRFVPCPRYLWVMKHIIPIIFKDKTHSELIFTPQGAFYKYWLNYHAI